MAGTAASAQTDPDVGYDRAALTEQPGEPRAEPHGRVLLALAIGV
jgi:hypothetical protein